MQKYCLTACAKSKLSKWKTELVEFLAIVAVVVIAMIALIIAMFIIGFLAQAVYVGIYGTLVGWEITITGSAQLMFFLIFAGGLAFMLLKVIYETTLNPMYNFFNNRIEDKLFGHEYDCKIFEKCE